MPRCATNNSTLRHGFTEYPETAMLLRKSRWRFRSSALTSSRDRSTVKSWLPPVDAPRCQRVAPLRATGVFRARNFRSAQTLIPRANVRRYLCAGRGVSAARRICVSTWSSGTVNTAAPSGRAKLTGPADRQNSRHAPVRLHMSRERAVTRDGLYSLSSSISPSPPAKRGRLIWVPGLRKSVY